MSKEYSATELRKIKLKRCLTPFCKNKSVVGRHYCHTCRMRKWAKKNPIKYVFYTLKGNAKRRKKAFSLTYDQFVSFISENDYMKLKGKTKYSLCIDRERNWEGYHIDNIKTITLSANSSKRNYVDYFRNQAGEMEAVTEETASHFDVPKIEDAPF